jgi:hypothetical protein
MGGADDSAGDSVELGHGARPIAVVAWFRLDSGTGTIAEVTAGETHRVASGKSRRQGLGTIR